MRVTVVTVIFVVIIIPTSPKRLAVVAMSRHWVELNHLLQGIQTAITVVLAIAVVVKFDALVGSIVIIVVGTVVREIFFARSCRRWW